MPLDLWEHVKKHRIVVAVRGIAPEQILPAAKALYDGGIRMLEITFDQASPTCLTDTPAAIRQVRQAMGDDMLVGAGTVMTLSRPAPQWRPERSTCSPPTWIWR